ncbi:alpha/beta fold hydrolase [Terrisporobacter petrolearius]|uniref:alpha/beta fold hydrolase n=1 Tax=Terrisporobacter petrolearius TaxID=1460447 RepID=UPI0031CC3A84
MKMSMLFKIILLALAFLLVLIVVRYFMCIDRANTRLNSYKEMTSSINTSFGKMTYIDKGSGEAVLICHGICGGYDQAYDALKDRVDDYRIIAPSRFGYIGSDMPQNATVKDQAKAYKELLDKLNIDKVYVLATSAGGTPAIRFALDYPERTKGLILYCSSMPYSVKPDTNEEYVGPPKQVCNNFTMWLISPLFEPLMGMDRSTINEILPINEKRDGIVFDSKVVNTDMNKNFDQYNVESLKVPTIVFNAKDDKLAVYSRTKSSVERFPNCTFISFESGGHLMTDNENKINSELDKFIYKYK